MAFVYGYVTQSFRNTFYGWAVGLGIAGVLCVIDWPFYNRNPVDWLDEVPPMKIRPELDGFDDANDADDAKPASKKRSSKGNKAGSSKR